MLSTGCKKAAYLMYNDIARIQLNDTSSLNATFVYDAPSVVRDTIYVQINTIGGFSDHDRAVKILQTTEYDYTYVRDTVTNQIVDTIFTEKPFKAVPGVHYVDFNDPSLQPLMVVRAGNVIDSIPIVLLRDTSLKTNSYRLRIQLQPNAEFGLGEVGVREKTIVFSDHLERFYSWRVDSYVAPAYAYFGKYSTGKHQFMIDVLKVNIDEAWYQAAVAAGAMNEYKALIKQALVNFNNDPANIASGKAPLRETDVPTSAVITFP
ncbi:DUF4843 domain-containing protein [Chitinophaga costaii]|nr:DUF4843 domain-containing protein [Chitinophaga costaii]